MTSVCGSMREPGTGKDLVFMQDKTDSRFLRQEPLTADT